MRPRNYSFIVLLLSLLVALAACNSSNKSSVAQPPVATPDTDPAQPAFAASLFDDGSSMVDNPYFPLLPGTSFEYQGANDDGEEERVELTVSHLTRTVDGVESVIVVAREYVDDELAEETFDCYAQDMEGNVWYLGEASTDYEEGEALDVAIILSNGESYSALQIRESTPLEPDALEEFKYYASGIGEVLAENVDGTERVELVASVDQWMPDISPEDFSNPRLINNPYYSFSIGETRGFEVYEEGELSETITIEILDTDDPEGDKVVNGIPVVVQRDRVRDDEGLIIEDTYDWFAQDDAGNVWYLGESVTNYNYNYDDEVQLR